MFYEGTEKRLEIIVKQADLLLLSELFWQDMVAQAGASIISKIENQKLRAYLLSESSLFVWPNRVLLITCGNTHLVKAAQFFQQKFPKDQIQSLLFHRHHAIQPERQISSFQQDYVLLNNHLQGRTYHWQDEYQGDLFFFGKLIEHKLNNKQLLMLHHLSGSFAQILHTGKIKAEQVESQLAIHQFFPRLMIDHFTFTPKGYSLNAISDRNYLTLHITPERLSTYLSLESSFTVQVIKPYIKHLIELFSPQSSQLMSFRKDDEGKLAVKVKNEAVW